jgi:hypothetical protein
MPAGFAVPKTLVVTGGNSNYDALGAELVASLKQVQNDTFKIGFLKIGAGDVPREIADRVDEIKHIEAMAAGTRIAGFELAFLKVKPRLPDLFPGHDVYIWLDEDTWVQNIRGLEALMIGASQRMLAVHPECDPHYFKYKIPSDRTVTLYSRVFSRSVSDRYIRFPMLNSGVFAAKATSAIWNEWDALLESMKARHGAGEAVFFSDQIPMHYLVYSKGYEIFPLRAVNNWQLYASLPLFDFRRKKLVVPTAPHEEINILHLAGDSKTARVRIDDQGRTSSYRWSEVQSVFGLANSAAPGSAV